MPLLIPQRFFLYGVFTWGLIVHSAWQPALGNTQEVVCKGTLGNLVVQRLRVPRGHICHLRGTTVRGNIIIEPRATLRSTGGQIQGNIRTYQDHRLELDPETWLRGRVLNLPELFR